MSTEELNIHREARRAERQKRRRRRILKRRITLGVIAALILALIVILVVWLAGRNSEEVPENNEPVAPVSNVTEPPETTPTPPPTPTPEEPEGPFYVTEDTAVISDAFPSRYAVLIDAESGSIIAQRSSDVPINPASMTKILTLLVAAEQIDDVTGTWTMTQEATEYCFVNKCSVVGYEVGEVVPVEELFYGCIMNSGADACLGLAELAAGSHEAFVVLMNEKLEELGIAETSHFTNCVGLYDEDHSCTMEDMALMLQTALKNDFCRQVLTTKLLMSAPTEQHPEGQALSNWFIRRIEDEDTGAVTVLAGKTGWVEESGFCAASYAEGEDGKGYLCVTGDSSGTWQSIYDHAELYKTYCS